MSRWARRHCRNFEPVGGFKHFSLRREPPPDDLVPFVEGFWSVRWDLEGKPPFAQEILPYPCVNLSTGAVGSRCTAGDEALRRSAFGPRRGFRNKVYGRRILRVYGDSMRELVDRIVSIEAAAGRAPCAPTTDDFDAVRSQWKRSSGAFTHVHGGNGTRRSTGWSHAGGSIHRAR